MVPYTHTHVKRWLLGAVLAGGTQEYVSHLLVWCHYPTLQSFIQPFNYNSSFSLTSRSRSREERGEAGHELDG